MQPCADKKLRVLLQAVEEGIKATDVPAVLQKCTSDLLDLTDLVRGKLGTQVSCFWQTSRRSLCMAADCSHTQAACNASTRGAHVAAAAVSASFCRLPGSHAGTSSCSICQQHLEPGLALPSAGMQDEQAAYQTCMLSYISD